MLRSFRVRNHRSIRDEVELNLLPVYDRSRPALPIAAIFGANAAGKSTVLDALAFMRSAVLDSFGRWDPAGVPRTPFRLSGDSLHGQSTYAVETVVDGTRYAYGFTVDDERVLAE